MLYSIGSWSFLRFTSFQFTLDPSENRYKLTIYNCYHCHFHVPHSFQFSGKIQVFVYRFTFSFFFSLSIFEWNSKINKTTSCLISLFCKLALCPVFWLRLGDRFGPQNTRELYASLFLKTDSGWSIYLSANMVNIPSLAQVHGGHLSLPFMPSLVILWCYFAAFVSYVITSRERWIKEICGEWGSGRSMMSAWYDEYESISLHNLQLQFFCALWIFDLT